MTDHLQSWPFFLALLATLLVLVSWVTITLRFIRARYWKQVDGTVQEIILEKKARRTLFGPCGQLTRWSTIGGTNLSQMSAGQKPEDRFETLLHLEVEQNGQKRGVLGYGPVSAGLPRHEALAVASQYAIGQKISVSLHPEDKGFGIVDPDFGFSAITIRHAKVLAIPLLFVILMITMPALRDGAWQAFFLILGGGLLVNSGLASYLLCRLLHQRTAMWPVVTGTVLEPMVQKVGDSGANGQAFGFVPRVAFQYGVNGAIYFCNWLSNPEPLHDSEENALKHIETYQRGGRILVKYNPLNPHECVVETPRQLVSFSQYAMAGAGCFMVICGAVLLRMMGG